MQKQVMVKAITLLMESFKAITEALKIGKRQQLDLGDIRNLIKLEVTVHAYLLKRVDAAILTAILRLFQKQRR